ncbi:uncharacterized protein KY384_003612 [Bacidia gigantensis]|uniref:uncharacterized protein n=1 Tax=Bacidia gigantensis TaxID=2732470 RepID=UPI001D04C906|nr:uncharacterized protein KY384_003612 [Bacidia gigantensis]KAG8531976.1 hypothetical protein KY384_003612 [Bacidia gigantensis]
MADGDTQEDDDERTIELSSLAAIYPELTIYPSSGLRMHDRKASLQIQVEPLKPLRIQPPNLANGISVSEEGGIIDKDSHSRGIHLLSYLPPLSIELSLPPDYPSKQPPVAHIVSQDAWLAENRTHLLEKACCTLWEDVGRDQVLYTYIDHVREAAEAAFGVGETLEVSPDLQVVLLDYDLKAKRAKFEKETFECSVCLEPKKGTVCHRLTLCSHVFCLGCLQDFFNSCISEGDVSSVRCIAPKCPEHPEPPSEPPKAPADRTLEPSELLQLGISQDNIQRYITLKRKRVLESNPNTIYCPRTWCQGPSTNSLSPKALENMRRRKDDPASTPPPLPAPAERLAICTDCDFAFCLVCKASWHGEYVICFPRNQFEITAEEKASEDYMLLHTQACPTCDARAQKTHGCNHMICGRCETHFCYLCGSWIEKENPYTHFNSRKSGCYMRLWELEEGDDGEIGQGFAGGANQGDRHAVMGEDEWSDDEDDEADRLDADMDPNDGRAFFPLDDAARPPRLLADDGRPARPRGLGADHRFRERDRAVLGRFLAMARADMEDEWDSDEMSGDEAEELED